MRWRAVAGGVCAAIVSGGAVVWAQPLPEQPVEGETGLEYVREKGAEGCPGEAKFRERVSAFFDDVDPFVEGGAAAPRRMRITLSRVGGGYRGVYSVLEEGRAPTRSVETRESCDVLVWELAERMHLAVARRPVEAGPEAPPASPSAPPAVVIVRECDATCMEEIERRLRYKYGRRMDLTLAVMAGGIVTAGWTLEVGPGAFLGFDVQYDWWSIGVEGRATIPVAAQRYYAGPNSDLLSFSGLLVPCARWKILFGCAFVELGQFTFTVPGGTIGDVSDVLFSFGPRGGVDVPIAEGFSVRGFADLAIHPFTKTVNVTDFDDPEAPVRSWTLPVVSGFFSVGIAWSR